MAFVGQGKSYIDSGIYPNQTYHMTLQLRDQNGNPVSASGVVLGAEARNATGNLSNFVVNDNGTFSFIYTTAAHGPADNNGQDDFYITVNGVRILQFWTNTY